MEKTYETWDIHEVARLLAAAEKLGLACDFEKTSKRLFGLNFDGKEYTHQNYGYRVTVYLDEGEKPLTREELIEGMKDTAGRHDIGEGN